MSIPITGILLLPLGLLIACLPWRYCLIGLMTLAMMSPAAVANAGSFGLQPGYYLALLLIVRTVIDIMAHGFTLNGFVMSRLRPLWWFTVVVFVVLFLALCFFQSVDTLPGTFGFKSGLAHPFRLARENFTQIAYLLLNLALIYAVAHNSARQSSARLLAEWDMAITCGLWFAVAVCVWQFANLYAGVPFPNDFFYSNAGYASSENQSMVGLFRINGPFEEPSTLGYTFTGYLLYAWGRYRAQPTGLTSAMIAACIFCMVVSTSTTAILGLFVFLAVAGFDIATGKTTLLSRDSVLSPSRAIVMGLIFLGVIAAAFVAAANWQAINVILDNVLFNKADTSSFQQRSFADYLALQIFTQTYGIGVGLGSHKANSLLLTLLSNTGFIGVLLFGWFVYALLRWKRSSVLSQTAISQAVRPFQLCLLGLLLIHLFSNPNLSTFTLWLVMGAVLSLQASEHGRVPVSEPVMDLQMGGRTRLAGGAA